MLIEHIKELLEKNYTPSLNLQKEELDSYVAKIIKQAVILTHFEKGHLCGFMAFYLNDKTETTFVTMIVVDQFYRGKGIANYMIGYWINYARKSGCRHAECEVNIENKGSIALFERSGLTVVKSNSGSTVKMSAEL